jgi:hypothetical protein
MNQEPSSQEPSSNPNCQVNGNPGYASVVIDSCPWRIHSAGALLVHVTFAAAVSLSQPLMIQPHIDIRGARIGASELSFIVALRDPYYTYFRSFIRYHNTMKDPIE